MSHEMSSAGTRASTLELSSPGRSNGFNRKSVPNAEILSKSSTSSTSGAGSSILQRNSPNGFHELVFKIK